METLPDLSSSDADRRPSPRPGMYQAQRPQTGPANNRPQPSRFLQDTAFKLGHDSHRSTSRNGRQVTRPFVADNGGNVQALSLAKVEVDAQKIGDVHCAEGDANMWRKIFHSEAMECVEAMQAVIDSANLNHCASRFEDWRKFDLRATAQMQQHVKEVMTLNKSLEGFLTQCATPDDFSKFKGSIVMLTEATEELGNTRREICKAVDLIAERASSKVVASWESDVRLASDVLRDHTREQYGRWASDDARWASFEAKLLQLQEHVGQLGNEVQRQTDEVSKLAATHCRESSQMASALQAAVTEMHGVASKSFQDLTETLKQDAEAHLQAIKTHTFHLFVGDGIEDSGESRRHQPSLENVLRDLNVRLHDWDNGSRKEAEQLKEASEKLKWQLKEQTREAKSWHSNAEVSQNKTAELDRMVAELRQELGHTQEELQVSRSMSMHNSMKRLKDIEGHGNLKINRHTGAVTLTKAVEFLPCKPTDEPVGRFVDPLVAGQTLQDLAHLGNAFEVAWMELDIRIKSSRAAAEDFWERLAESQATLAREQIELHGYPSDKLIVKGTVGTQESDCVVRLDTTIFVDAGKPKGNARGTKR